MNVSVVVGVKKNNQVDHVSDDFGVYIYEVSLERAYTSKLEDSECKCYLSQDVKQCERYKYTFRMFCY